MRAKTFYFTEVRRRNSEFLIEAGADLDRHPGDKACIHVQDKKSTFVGHFMTPQEMNTDHISGSRFQRFTVFFIKIHIILTPDQFVHFRKLKREKTAVVKVTRKGFAHQIRGKILSVTGHIQCTFPGGGKIRFPADVPQIFAGINRFKWLKCSAHRFPP